MGRSQLYIALDAASTGKQGNDQSYKETIITNDLDAYESV